MIHPLQIPRTLVRPKLREGIRAQVLQDLEVGPRLPEALSHMSPQVQASLRPAQSSFPYLGRTKERRRSLETVGGTRQFQDDNVQATCRITADHRHPLQQALLSTSRLDGGSGFPSSRSRQRQKVATESLANEALKAKIVTLNDRAAAPDEVKSNSTTTTRGSRATVACSRLRVEPRVGGKETSLWSLQR
jgi:hypothetical protein